MAAKLKKELERRAWILFSVMAVGVIAVCVFMYLESVRPRPLGDLGCINRQAGDKVAILVDKSDDFSAAQQDELKRIFDGISDRLKQNDLLSIYLLDEPDAMKKKPSFSMCIPEKNANAMYENQRKVQDNYQHSFGQKFDSIIAGAIKSSAIDSSPILEMIQRISRASYFEKKDGGKRTIYILSDFLQNENGYSFYKQDPDFESFSASEYGKKLLSDTSLDGASVYLVVIPRDNISFEKMQKVKKFWIDYMRFQGVASVNTVVLP